MRGKGRIPAGRYDKAYLLSENTEGYEAFKQGSLSYLKQSQLDMLQINQPMSLLEVGFGRGEFLYHCAKRGARVSGVDYSPSALEIGSDTLREFPNADLRIADCKELPFKDNSFERVYSGDVIEHQDLDDGAQMLKEMYRVLEPGGFMLVHTSPNTVFTKVVYRIARPFLKMINRRAIQILEEHMEVNKEAHVHEYNLISLRKVARMAGLSNVRIWIAEDILRSSQHRHTRALSENKIVRFVGKLGRLGAIRFLLGNDLYLKCYKE
jgi:ubiquinone/menaquinone biosynthesis C-methylase UbiE